MAHLRLKACRPRFQCRPSHRFSRRANPPARTREEEIVQERVSVSAWIRTYVHMARTTNRKGRKEGGGEKGEEERRKNS